MILNYLKITWAVMKRRKFYTFISLFGIATTLTVLIVLVAFLDHLLAPNYPETNRDRSLYVMMLRLTSSNEGYSMSSPLGLKYAEKYVLPMKTPTAVGLSSTEPTTANIYREGKRLSLLKKYTNGAFWDVTAFEFLEGKAFTQQSIENNEYVVVINDQTRDDYFGKGVSAVGKTFEMEDIQYRVVGVVRGSPVTRIFTAADVYLPYNTSKTAMKNPDWGGEFTAILLANNPSELPAIRAEYADIVRRAQADIPPGQEYNVLSSTADTYLEGFTRNLLGSPEDSGRSTFFMVLGIFALFFMSLPALNLTNINISRILERASEIGIRKAFGASARRLVGQFVVENLLITLIGGVIALLLSGLIIWAINAKQVYAYVDLRINWTVAFSAIAVSLIFGLLSGVYPAWRMSRLHIAEALKGA